MADPKLKLVSPRKVYEPVRTCIYCGASDCRLTLEHVIPAALWGNLELPEACCLECQPRINKFEQPVLRTMLGNFRATHGMAKRRKKSRPTLLPITADMHRTAEVTSIKQVPVAEFPRMLQLLRQEPAGLLVGRSHSSTLSLDISWNLWGPDANRLMNAATLNLGLVDQKSFCLMLAKIAHAYVIGERGYSISKNYKMLLPPFLLGEDDRYDLVVGGQPKADPPPEPNVLHKLQIEEGDIAGTRFLIVHIRLFAYVGAPRYHAVFGQI